MTDPTNDRAIQDRITGFWNAVASGYEAHGGNVPARESSEFDAWVHTVANLLPAPPVDVLDVATGTGFVALIAAGLGHRVTAIDLAEPMLAEGIKEAELRGLEVTFRCDDAVAPALPPQSFDAVINRHLFWTLRDPARALAAWRRLLRPGGRVVTIDGFWFDPDKEPNEFFASYYTPETRAHLPGWQYSEAAPIGALFAAAGFSDVSVVSLDDVHRVATNPPSPQPPYALVGFAQ